MPFWNFVRKMASLLSQVPLKKNVAIYNKNLYEIQENIIIKKNTNENDRRLL